MSWTLHFYRRVGAGELAIEEVDRVLERAPRFTRVPPREVDPLAEREVRFGYENPITGARFRFTFRSPAEGEPEEPGQVDFPFELTPLQLVVDLPQPPEVAQEAVPVAAEVCLQLDLLVLDPQIEQQLPAPPGHDALVRSFVGFSRDVQETLDYLPRARRRFALLGCITLLLILLLFVLFVISRS